MITILTDKAIQFQCPRCGAKDGLKTGGPTFRGHRPYDVMTDTFGVMRCSQCGHRAHTSAFQVPIGSKQGFQQ